MVEKIYKWMPGQEEPSYDDGKPERIDYINSQKVKLAGYHWPRKSGLEMCGAVLLSHGIDSHTRWDYLTRTGKSDGGEWTWHAPTYDGSVIEMLNEAGFDVYGMDACSYGASDGHFDNMRAYFHKFDDLVSDLIGFTKEKVITKMEAERPLFVMGVSMGGCISTRLLQTVPELFSGGILSAPMLSVDQLKKKPINRVLLPISGFVSASWPTFAVAQKAPNVYPQEQKAFNSEPLCYPGKTRARVAYECVQAVDEAKANMHKLVTPVLVIISLTDTMTDYHGAVFLRENAASKDKTVTLLENGMWHALLHEPGRDANKAEILAWVTSRSTEWHKDRKII